jgi:metal-dependent hydrolase (beta-lactamase superfamily II)
VDGVRVTVLTEDYAGYDSPLWGSHGISLLLDIHAPEGTRYMLFDVSQSSEPILHNMEILGISAQCIDAVFPSHGHYDHTMGLAGMVKAIGKEDLPLIDADEDRIAKTAQALRELDVEDLYVGHCTGLRGEAHLLGLFKDRLHKLHSGMRIDL